MEAILFHPETSIRRALILAIGAYGTEGLNPSERKGSVESPHSDDIRSNAEPVWIKHRVTRPALQIRKAWWECAGRKRASPGQPEKFTAIHLHLGHEEVMIRRKADRYSEGYVELDLLPADWPIAAWNLAGQMDAPRLNRIECPCKRS